MLTELPPVFAITATFNDGSIAIACGDAPTPKLDATPVAISPGPGSTAILIADMLGFARYDVIIPHDDRIETRRRYAGGRNRHRQLLAAGQRCRCARATALHGGLRRKYPPTTFTRQGRRPRRGIWVTATTAGRDGTTVKPCGPARLPETSPFCACTTSRTSPARANGPAGIVARNELAVMKTVGTATGGFPTITTSFELKFVPAR